MPSTPELIRTQILALVKEYHTAKFAHKTFDPDKDLIHYAGRVFDAEEIVNLKERKPNPWRPFCGFESSVSTPCKTLNLKT